MRFLLIILLIILRESIEEDTYNMYLNLWKNKVPTQKVFSLKDYQSEDEMCGNSPCPFFYFQYSNITLNEKVDKNSTILLVSGLRGDDKLSHITLLNAYGSINAAKIIFFPYANPSGFLKDSKLTYPGKIDVQNDFPIGNVSSCKKSLAYKILEYLYFTYKIDLTIYLHGGAPIFSYSWANKYSQDNSRTQQFGIYTDLGQMVRYYGEQTKDLTPYKVGTLFELNSGSAGHFIDWAYGATKVESILSSSCSATPNVPHSAQVMNGLVLFLGIGQSNSLQIASQKTQKNIQRGLNILNKIIKITNPSINLAKKLNILTVRLFGCKAGAITNLKIANSQGELLFEKTGSILIKGDILYGPQPINNISLPQHISFPSELKYEVDFECDSGWVSLGSTIFGDYRSFKQVGVISSLIQSQKIKKSQIENRSQISIQQSEESTQKLSLIQILGLILILFGLVWLIIGARMSLKIQNKQKIKNFSERFQIVEFVQENEEIDGISDQKGKKSGNGVSIQELTQLQTSDNTRLTIQ